MSVNLFPALYSQVAVVPQVPAYLGCSAAVSASGTLGSYWEQETLLLINDLFHVSDGNGSGLLLLLTPPVQGEL